MLLLGASAEASPALGDDVWISTDAEGARVVESLLGPSAQATLTTAPTPGQELLAVRLPRAQLEALSSAMHAARNRCGGFALHDSLKAAQRATEQPTPTTPDTTGALQVQYLIDNAATVTPLLPKLLTANLQKTIEDLSAYPTRLHSSETGKQAALWIRDRWQSFANGRADVKVELITHKGTPQPSVALTITGAKQPAEIVVLGGHLDSINGKGGLAPGADDNASGIAVLTEVARVALEAGYQPDRSVVFYAYAAEEIGLVGSGEIAADAKAKKLNVVGVLQLDMTNYNPSPSPYVAIVTDFTDAMLNGFARQLVDEYVGVPWKDTKCGYACSDHGPWSQRGFPAHYVHESTTDESNDHIHTAEDTLALTNGKADHSLYFARYGVAYMAELAKGSLPPVTECDASRPCAGNAACQNGTCVANVGGSAGAGGGGGGAAGALSAGGAGAPDGALGGNPTSGAVGGGVVGGAAGTGGLSTAVGGAATSPANPSVPATTDSANGCACRAANAPASPQRWLWLLLPAAGLFARRHAMAGVT